MGTLANQLAAIQAQQSVFPTPTVAPLAPSAIPALPMAAQPSVVAAPAPLQNAVAKQNQLASSGSGIDQVHNGVLRGILHGADILGSVFAPRLDSLIPGTGLHHQLLLNQQSGLVSKLQDQQNAQQDQQNKQAEISLAQRRAELAENQAAASAPVEIDHDHAAQLGHPELEGISLAPKDLEKLVQNKDTVAGRQGVADTATQRAYALKGLKPDGTPDEDNPVWKANQAHAALWQAQAELAAAGNDPSSPKFKLAEEQLAARRQEANAAGERAAAYMGQYQLRATGRLMDGQVAPGASIIQDDAGNQQAVGTAFAPQAVKAQAQAAQFNDVHGALDGLEQAATKMVQSGQKFNDPNVMYALQHAPADRGLMGNYIASLNKSNLTPEQRDYVAANLSAHENIQALRKSAGGTATDTAVAKLDAMIPGADTPDLDYFMRQTHQIRQTATRLGSGAPQVAGGLKVRGTGPQAPEPPKAGDVQDGYRFKGGKPSDPNNWEKVGR